MKTLDSPKGFVLSCCASVRRLLVCLPAGRCEASLILPRGGRKTCPASRSSPKWVSNREATLLPPVTATDIRCRNIRRPAPVGRCYCKGCARTEDSPSTRRKTPALNTNGGLWFSFSFCLRSKGTDYSFGGSSWLSFEIFFWDVRYEP